MQRISLFIIIFALALSACATQSKTTLAPTILATSTESTEFAATPTAEQSSDPLPSTGQDVKATQAVGATGSSPSPVTFSLVPEESQVTYEVGETFIDQGNVFNVAEGVTQGISGSVTIDYANPQNSSLSPISIDISQFVSDSNRRDNALRERFLESAKYPIATFTPTKIEGLPAVGEEGVDYPLKISGDLTIREISIPVTFDATVRLDGEALTGTATTTILMSDYGFGPINIAGILSTEDEVKLNFNFVARPTP